MGGLRPSLLWAVRDHQGVGDNGSPTSNRKDKDMAKDIEVLKVLYREKQAKYNELVDALVFTIEAADRIVSLTDEAQAEMLATGKELLEAMKEQAV